MATCIIKLIENSSLIERISENAFKKKRNMFSVEKMVKGIETVFNE